MSEKPLLNIPVVLILKVKSNVTFKENSNISAKIELPESFELVSGNLSWEGNLKKNEEQKIKVVVKSTKVGYFQLKGIILNQDNVIGGSNIIYVEVSQNDAIIGGKPENYWDKDTSLSMLIPVSQNNEQIQSELIILPKPELNKKFTISYRLTSLINIPDPQGTQVSLVFPSTFEVIDVQFPEGGETYESESQLAWKGSITKKQTVGIKAIFKVTTTGWGTVFGCLDVQSRGKIVAPIKDVKTAELRVDKYMGETR